MTTAVPQPHEAIWSLTNALVPSSCLHLIAELGLADHLDEQPRSVDELARTCGVDADALDRVLCLLASCGIFLRSGRSYMHSPASRLLRSDHPMSMRAFARLMGLPLIGTVFSNLEYSVQTGAPAVARVEPNGFWAYLQDHPDEAQIFGQAMSAKAAADISAVLGAYDFTEFSCVADIGGGRGHLLRAVLDSARSAKGVLFDLPGVIETLDIADDRLALHAGDFFVDPLPKADAYLLMEVLHDWRDAECVAILSAIRRAAPSGGRVLVIENILPDDEADVRGHTLDVLMLAVTGGRERTTAELEKLFQAAGLRRGRLLETQGPLRILEATCAG
jgi:O-methyltransferase